MSATTAPASSSIAEVVATASGPLLPHGGNTKPGLTAAPAEVQRVDVRALRGIVTYEPSEFLITARAGTPISELVAALAEKGQYLPFDPLFVAEGATLGGTVASGLSGSNRLLYGGLRDFVMEVELVDGLGKLVRGGGKVVKNSAGFDLPKLVVGSYGRLGILTEVTLKVFPQPQAHATVVAQVANIENGRQLISRLSALPLPLAALDLDPQPGSTTAQLFIRFGGPTAALTQVLARAADWLNCPHEKLQEPEAEAELWNVRSQRLTTAAPGQLLVRVASSLNDLPGLDQAMRGAAVEVVSYAAAGSLAWLRLPEAASAQLDTSLQSLQLSAVAITGTTPELRLLGHTGWLEVARRIQSAMDPNHKFVAF